MRIALAAAVMLLASGAASAQLPDQLTLDDAVSIARANNPAHRKAANDQDVAAAEVRQSYGAFLPTVGASMSFNGSSSQTSSGQGDFGEVVDGEVRTIESSSGSHGVSASMTLFDGGAMFRDLSAARAREDVAHATLRASLNRLDAEVRRAYFQAQRAEQTIALEDRLLASARDRLARTEELFRIAAASQVDVLGARVDVASQEQSLARARDEARKLRLALLQTMGLPPRDAGGFTLSAAEPRAFDPAVLDADALVALALDGNPAVVQSQAAAIAADRRASAARGVRWPSIDATFGYNRSVREPGMFDAFGQLEAQDRGFRFGLSASLPLFSNFRAAASIAQADAAREDASEDERAARLQTERDVRSAVIDLENAFGQLRLAEQKAELSAQRLELATEQYRLGALTFLNLQRVIDETANAERQALEARYGFMMARVTLEERLGAPLPQP